MDPTKLPIPAGIPWEVFGPYIGFAIISLGMLLWFLSRERKAQSEERSAQAGERKALIEGMEAQRNSHSLEMQKQRDAHATELARILNAHSRDIREQREHFSETLKVVHRECAQSSDGVRLAVLELASQQKGKT